MATGFLSPIGMGQWFTDQGVVLTGGPAGTTSVQIPDGAYVGIGSTYDGQSFSAPPQPPSTVM
jgi:hypothetical protein